MVTTPSGRAAATPTRALQQTPSGRAAATPTRALQQTPSGRAEVADLAMAILANPYLTSQVISRDGGMHPR